MILTQSFRDRLPAPLPLKPRPPLFQFLKPEYRWAITLPRCQDPICRTVVPMLSDR